jgi:hypothetical protein
MDALGEQLAIHIIRKAIKPFKRKLTMRPREAYSTITEERTPTESRFIFLGKFTRDTELDIAGRIIPYLTRNRRLTIDLTKVTDCDTTFLARIVQTLRAIKENYLSHPDYPANVLIYPSERINHLMDINRCKTTLEGLGAILSQEKKFLHDNRVEEYVAAIT